MDNCRFCNKQYFKKTDKYGCCSIHCITELKYKNFIEIWLQDLISEKEIIHNFIRRYLFEKFENKCSICGWNKKNPFTNKIPLQLDHINGNRSDNTYKNLRLLCPNCHSLTATFGHLNTKIGPALRPSLQNSNYNKHLYAKK